MSVLNPGPHTLLRAEELGEIWIERNGVMQRPKRKKGTPEDVPCREDIFCLENCAYLTSYQNHNFSKAMKVQARMYLLSIYGEEKINAFLKRMRWSHNVDQLLAI